MSNLKNPPPPKEETHPAYGMVGLARSMNGRQTRLFGSALADHASTMRLTIRRAVHMHDAWRDDYFAREELIEVEMSAAQFAEFITNPNVGHGVPCTIRHHIGEKIPPIPAQETQVHRIKREFRTNLDEAVQTLQERRVEIEQLTKGLSAKARERLRIELDVMVQQLTSNIPYVLERFNEASEEVVTAAKQEIEQFTSHVLRAAGMEALAEGRLPKMLGGSLTPRDEQEE